MKSHQKAKKKDDAKCHPNWPNFQNRQHFPMCFSRENCETLLPMLEQQHKKSQHTANCHLLMLLWIREISAYLNNNYHHYSYTVKYMNLLCLPVLNKASLFLPTIVQIFSYFFNTTVRRFYINAAECRGSLLRMGGTQKTQYLNLKLSSYFTMPWNF